MKHFIILIFSILLSVSANSSETTDTHVISNMQQSYITLSGSLKNTSIITVIADGKVYQTGGKKIIQKPNYPFSATALMSSEVVISEVFKDPGKLLKGKKTMHIVWTKTVSLQSGREIDIFSQCPAIPLTTRGGDKSILFLKHDTLSYGYTLEKSAHIKHIEALRKTKPLTQEQLHYHYFSTAQDWMPFRIIGHENKDQPKVTAKIKRDLIAGNFLTAGLYSVQRVYARDTLMFRLSRAEHQQLCQLYTAQLELAKDQYMKLENPDKEVLKLMQEIVEGAKLYISREKVFDPKSDKPWSEPGNYTLQNGFNTRFAKLAELINAPDSVLIPKPYKKPINSPLFDIELK